MQPQDVAPRTTHRSHRSPDRGSASPGPAVGVEQAEAALIEHYPRLVRLAYLILPPGLGRSRRVLTAHALTQRALPKGRGSSRGNPARSHRQGRHGREGDPAYAYVRRQIVRTALEAGAPGRGPRWLRQLLRRQLPSPLPQVWGLRLSPSAGGADELALDRRLSALSAPARAAYVLRGLERLPDDDVRQVLRAAGIGEAHAALREADGVPVRYTLLDSPEFDPCSLQARPTDLVRRRHHAKAALAGLAALAVTGVLQALPGDGWGPDGAAAPPYARNAAAEAALDPAKVTRVTPGVWRTSSRTDFSVWPARGNRTGDRELLRRALAVWARPGASVQVSATVGTPSGGPAGPPQLLYAGELDAARVVLFYDGLRVVRYAEPADGTGGAALDVARVDAASGDGASAVVVGRSDGNVRYLTAPWVRKAAERDLLKPTVAGLDLPLEGGVTAPLASPAARTGSACSSWNALELTEGDGSGNSDGNSDSDGGSTRLLSDLGELTPAVLTTGRPSSALRATESEGGAGDDGGAAEARRAWAPYACSLAGLRGQGVRSVNAWAYAGQPLPDDAGQADWVCTRAETWRGTGTQVFAQFRTPGAPGTVAARAEDVPECGARAPRVLAGVLWKSPTGDWYLLAAGGPDVVSVTASGGVSGSADGNVLALPAGEGQRAALKGRTENGSSVRALG